MVDNKHHNKNTSSEYVLRVVNSFLDIDTQEWEHLYGTNKKTLNNYYNPFISYNFISSLEEGNCATSETGWLAQHLILENEKGAIIAALPCYLKSHSQGEYVFDHAWADAYERAGGSYYPKLQASIPFTPVTGPKLLIRNGIEPHTARTALARGLKTLTERHKISSAHVTFATDEDINTLTSEGFLHRTDQQFHFINRNYTDYQDFLETLSSRKRKNLKKERDVALQNNITIEHLTGSDLTPEIMDIFYSFYLDTGSRKWGHPYLSRDFFKLISVKMADDIVLIMAKRAGRYIAGAINFIGSNTLYGRHWGCIEHHKFLHFEVCYHQAIDFAIKHGLKTVEAGAQGEHKLARGYEPVTTHSAHYIAHNGFSNAVEDYLRHERSEVARFGKILNEHTPYKK